MTTANPSAHRQAVVQRVADAVWQACAQQQSLAPFGDELDSLGIDAAYDAARLLRQRRQGAGCQVLGRKIGFTNRAIWPVYGVYQPIWGAVDSATVQVSDHAKVTRSLAGLLEPRIEPELMLHLARTPAPGADAQALLRDVDAVAHGFEIVQSPFPQWRFGTADAVASGSLHGALLMGPAVALSALGPDPMRALVEFGLTLCRNGSEVDRGRGANVLDGPLQALAHLHQSLAARPADEQLRAGEWISTGTLTAAWPVAAGETWTTTLGGLPLPGFTLELTA